MKNISFRVEPDLEATILYRMKKAGAKDVSSYLRQICSTGGYDIDSHLGRMQREINMLTEQVEQQQKLLNQLLAKDKDVDLQLLAGIYKMLHMAVEPDVRAVMAQDINFAAVDAYSRNDKKAAGLHTDPVPESPQEPPQEPPKPKNSYWDARERFKAKLLRKR
ncbi:hypothetical protein RY831_30670 [Noviherbaspirillum sp. CPCC 100848]|uniref:Uncharacterized protein n=1 Tax=Noviherbaspirillum album TaxID=3080276 RepID=A0ABU6JJY2_9BURK|nr:hypothetical protein [Noviherbaspirillum sp. CPCC 100848]MEC4723507.1 hypothetical protein [Noviherbaspirillum sp. CPCC 100848]